MILFVSACDEPEPTRASRAAKSASEKKGDTSQDRQVEAKEATATADTIELSLYFSDEAGLKLVRESRIVTFTPEPAKATIEELLAGPTPPNEPTIPPGTRLNGLRIEEGVAIVDLSGELITNHPGGSTGERQTVYSIVNSLTEWPTIDAVRILVDGEGRETIKGHVDISGPLERDEGAL